MFLEGPEEGSFEQKLKVLVPFKVTKTIGGQLAPLSTPLFSSDNR